MEWITDKRTGAQTGLLFIFGLVVLDFVCLIVMTTQPIGPLTFFMGLLILASLPVIAVLAYQLYGLSRSGYDVDRNAVTIQWGAIRQIVPRIWRLALSRLALAGIDARAWRVT